MEKSIGNVPKTVIKLLLTNFHVDACFMYKVHFVCGIIDTREAQDKEIRRIYKKITSNKVKPRKQFPTEKFACKSNSNRSRNNVTRKINFSIKIKVVFISPENEIRKWKVNEIN